MQLDMKTVTNAITQMKKNQKSKHIHTHINAHTWNRILSSLKIFLEKNLGSQNRVEKFYA